MKIGLVCPYNIAKGGAVQEIVKAMQIEFDKRGHQTVIITPQPRQPYAPDNHRIAFLGSATDFNSPLHTTIQVSASVLTDEIDNLLEYEKLDVLHFHEPWVPVLSRQILSRSNTANVATFHAKLPETLVSKTLTKVITPYTKPLLRYIDEFTAVSPAAAEYLLTLTDVPVDIIPNAISLRRFQQKPAVEQSKQAMPTILYVGRLEHRKGVRYLLEAFQVLQQQQPEVQLVLIGDGPDREKLEELTATLQLQHVTFLGFVDNEVKMSWLHAADLFCSPAIFGESFGIVLLEAMATGTVTVAGNNPGYESVMQGLGKLSLINPKEKIEFAHRLSLLLNDVDLRQLWKKWAKDYVKQYDYGQVAGRYEAIYEAAIEKHKQRLTKKK